MKMIIATSLNGCIGHKSIIPWQCPEDLNFFRKMTRGKTVLCGRKTFESLPEKNGIKLPGRQVCVLTHNCQAIPNYALSFKGWEQFLSYTAKEAFVIGGADVYGQAIELNLVTEIYWSFILENIDGDTYFPMSEKINQCFIKDKTILENSQVKIYHYEKRI